jgi:hypothetical protein
MKRLTVTILQNPFVHASHLAVASPGKRGASPATIDAALFAAWPVSKACRSNRERHVVVRSRKRRSLSSATGRQLQGVTDKHELKAEIAHHKQAQGRTS